MAENYFPRRTNKRKIVPTGIENKKYQPAKKKIKSNCTPIEPLTYQAMTEGMIILGCVSEIGDFNITMSLPGCLVGTVSITNISRPYTKLLNLYDKEPSSKEKSAKSLQSMFKIGSIFPCIVLRIKKNAVVHKYSVDLSINPADVYKELQPSSLHYHSALYAAVKSVEDHAYIMDVGIRGLTGCILIKANFQNEDGEKSELSVGQVIPTIVVSKAKELISSRVVQLHPHPLYEPFPKIQKLEKMTLNAFIPGMIVEAVVKSVTKQGLFVSCGNFEGCVYKDHIDKTYQADQFLEIEVIATVLYMHPITRIIYFSLYPKPSSGQFCQIFQQFSKHDVIESAIVTSVQKNSICLNLGDFRGKAKCPGGKVSEAYPVNSTIKCQVCFLHPLDNVVKVSLKQSDLAFDFKELKIGDICQGKVKCLVKNGMVVSLKPNLEGFVRDIHMFDGPLTKPEALFACGSNVLCRVLCLSTLPLRVKLTCKKSLMDSFYTILSSYDDAFPGLITKGVIVLISEHYILVSFYNEVQGIVTSKEFHPSCSKSDKNYFIGQAVKCCVIQCSPESKLLKLSLKIKEQPVPEKPISKNDFELGKIWEKTKPEKHISKNAFQLGKIYNVLVKSKTKKAITVSLVDSSETACLPYNHLSDHLENCFILNSSYKVNDRVEVLCFSKDGTTIVTKKFSFLQAAERNILCSKICNFQVGKILPAVVRSVNDGGMVVELGHNIKGHVSRKFMSDCNMVNTAFLTGQSVVAKVLRVNFRLNEIDLTTRVSDIYDGNPEYSLDFLQGYLQDRNMITNFFSKSDGVRKTLAGLQVGSIVRAKIIERNAAGVHCELECNIKGHAAHKNCDNLLQEHLFHNAVVLFVDFEANVVELSFSTHLIKCTFHVKDDKSSEVKMNQTIRCQVVLKTSDFILVGLEGHCVGRLAYLPSRRVINDEVGRHRDYSLGSKYHIVVKRLSDNFILGILKSHNKLYEERQQHKSLYIAESFQAKSCPAINSDMCEQLKSTDDEMQIPNDFEDNRGCKYAVGECHKALIRNVKKFQINVVLENGLQGRIHITKLGIISEGICPMKMFSAGETLDVHIIGFLKKKSHKYLEFSHRRFLTYAECSLSPSLHSKSDFEFTIGKNVFGFVKEISDQTMTLWLSPNLTCVLQLLDICNSAKNLRMIKKLYKIGQSIQVTVKSYQNPFSSSSLNRSSIRVTKQMNWKPNPGGNIAALIQIASPDRGLILKLANQYHGTVAMTDLTDDFQKAECMILKFAKKRFIQCYVLEVDHKTKYCILSTRSSRLYQNHSDIIDQELTIKDFGEQEVGSIMRGLVKCVTPKTVHVSLGRDLEGTVPVKEILNEDTGNQMMEYRIGSVVTVVVMEKLDHSFLLSVV